VKARTIQLGEMVSIVGGGTPSRDRADYFDGEIPWVTVKDFSDDFFIRGSRERISRLGLEDSASRLIPAGNVLLVTRMSVGKAAINLVDVAINQDLKALFCNPQLDPRYLTFFLTLASPRLEAQASGATVKGITLDDVEALEIPLPDLSEQQRIAARLEQAHRLRRTRRYALELSDTLLPAAFLELFGDPITNPLGFPIAELGDFLSFVTSGSRGWAEYYVTEGARFIRSLDVRMNYISDEDAVFVNPPQGAEADRTRVKAGDVLLTITGSQIGRVAPVPDRVDGAFISQHVAILRLKSGLLPVFLSMFLSLGVGGQREIARLQYGQTKPGLNLDQIREFRIPVPPLSLQQKFAGLVERAERLRSVQRESLRQAEHLFATLLHHAFVMEA
jgi:type I restriction enzyme S subunit